MVDRTDQQFSGLPSDRPHQEGLFPNAQPLPTEIGNFRKLHISRTVPQLTKSEWYGALHAAEVSDRKQQIFLRPWFAFGVFILLATQNIGIWFIVIWAMQRNELDKLQFIFSALIGGTLTQSYFILKFITNKVFSDITYPSGDGETFDP